MLCSTAESKIVWIIEREHDGEFYTGRGYWSECMDQALQLAEHWDAEQLAGTMLDTVLISSIRVEIANRDQ